MGQNAVGNWLFDVTLGGKGIWLGIIVAVICVMWAYFDAADSKGDWGIVPALVLLTLISAGVAVQLYIGYTWRPFILLLLCLITILFLGLLKAFFFAHRSVSGRTSKEFRISLKTNLGILAVMAIMIIYAVQLNSGSLPDMPFLIQAGREIIDFFFDPA